MIMRAALCACAGLAFAVCTPAAAQSPDVTAPAPSAIVEPPPAAPAAVHLVNGMAVEIELVDALSSRTNAPRDAFAIRLATPIVVNGRTVVEAGALGTGEVIDAGRAGIGGKPGKLILAARTLQVGDTTITLRGLRFAMAGDNNTNAAMALTMVPYAGLAAIFVTGGNVEAPAGARGVAKIAADVDIVPPAPTQIAAAEAITPPAPVASSVSSQGENP